MSKVKRKRHSHGTTSFMVVDALVKLHTQGGQRVPVPRSELLAVLRLPETTVDDRLRTLVKEGRILRVGRALYEPTPWPARNGRMPETPASRRSRLLREAVLR